MSEEFLDFLKSYEYETSWYQGNGPGYFLTLIVEPEEAWTVIEATGSTPQESLQNAIAAMKNLRGVM